MTIEAGEHCRLIARPSRRSPVDDEDWSSALLYRNAREYAAGHTCSADWVEAAGGERQRWFGQNGYPKPWSPLYRRTAMRSSKTWIAASSSLFGRLARTVREH